MSHRKYSTFSVGYQRAIGTMQRDIRHLTANHSNGCSRNIKGDK